MAGRLYKLQESLQGLMERDLQIIQYLIQWVTLVSIKVGEMTLSWYLQKLNLVI